MKSMKVCGVIAASLLLLAGCTDVEMNPYANGSGPAQAPTYGNAGVQPDFGRIDRGIDTVPPYHADTSVIYHETVIAPRRHR